MVISGKAFYFNSEVNPLVRWKAYFLWLIPWRWRCQLDRDAVGKCIAEGQRRGKNQFCLHIRSYLIGWVYSPGPDSVRFWAAELCDQESDEEFAQQIALCEWMYQHFFTWMAAGYCDKLRVV